MSLKGRIAKYAGAKVVEKLASTAVVEETVNNIINVVNKYSRKASENL